MARVTCIINFLNEARFLEEAIRSVLNQTHADWELLLVDDGSTDGSGDLAFRWAERLPERIRYLTHAGRANRGASASRNLGLSHATGDFVAFLDGDDAWLEGKLAEQLEIFDGHPEAIMVCGATSYWRSWSAPPEDGRDEVVHVGVASERLYQPPHLLKALYPLGRGTPPSMSNMMLRRRWAIEAGGFENSFPGLYDDQVMKTKAYLDGPVFVSGSCWDRYRQHPASCVALSRERGLYWPTRERFLVWMSGYLDEIGCRDEEVRNLVDSALRPFRFPPFLPVATFYPLRGRIRRAVRRFI